MKRGTRKRGSDRDGERDEEEKRVRQRDGERGIWMWPWLAALVLTDGLSFLCSSLE